MLLERLMQWLTHVSIAPTISCNLGHRQGPLPDVHHDALNVVHSDEFGVGFDFTPSYGQVNNLQV